MIKIDVTKKKNSSVSLSQIDTGRWFEWEGGLYLKVDENQYYSSTKDEVLWQPQVFFPYINYVKVTRIECEHE